MIHTIHIDDSTLKGKRIIKELQKETKIVHFVNPTLTNDLPDGYISGANFRNAVKQGLKNKLKENGYL